MKDTQTQTTNESEAPTMKMELYQGEKMEVRVNIPSIKKSRNYILNLFSKDSSRTHIVYRGCIYNASDIYAGRKGVQTH